MTKDDIYYNAMLARDYRFDGKFFVGVKTTKIYCRPICPAKPQRKNVEFFPTHLAAELAGHRPCMRCRPESAPDSPAWIGRSSLVRRGVKMLHDLSTPELSEDQWANRFGVSARHLRRVFIDEIGKTPKQLFYQNRLGLSRKLILETHLSITEIAFASGFKSIRRFNDAFKEKFKHNPREIRRLKTTKSEYLKVSLSYRPPFDFEGLISTYQSHRIGNLEWFEHGKMHRVIHMNGSAGVIAISNDPEHCRLWLEIDFPDSTQLHNIIRKVRSLFDLDSDPLIVANVLEMDPKIKSLINTYPGIRLPSGWDPFEIAIGTILGQLVSVERARALILQLTELLGTDSGIEREGKKIKLFPTPSQILASDLEDLKTTTQRKKTILAFTQALVDSKISLTSTQSVDTFLKEVLAIKGIGPWTAHYMALKVLRHADAFPHTDLILARALVIHPMEIIKRMHPWRGYVATLFWRHYYGILKK